MKKLNNKIRKNVLKKTMVLVLVMVLVLIIVLVLITFTSRGCSKIKYEIITEKTLQKGDYTDYFEEDSEEVTEKSPEIINKYKATTIIRSTDTSIWFIDDNGSFQFITADKIQIIEIE